jgi:hypothetical protein
MAAIMEFIRLDAHMQVPVRGRYTYYASAAEARLDSAVGSEDRLFKLLAEIKVTGDAQGVICAQRSRCGSYSLFLRDHRLVFVYDVPGIAPAERLTCDIPPFGDHIVGVEFTRQARDERGDATGAVRLLVDGRPMCGAPLRTTAARFAPCGEGLCIGYDATKATRREYESTFPLVGARVIEIVFDVAEEAFTGGGRERAMAQARH